MKKSMYIGIAIIVILIIIVICVFAGNSPKKPKENTLENSAIITNKEVIDVQNMQINEQVNEAISNELENETVVDELENTVSSETFEESPKTSEEKAIEIAKKDWGENSNAEFSVEGIDGNGNYIVAVRNSQTTEALAFYTVNVTNQNFTKREMN